MEREKQREMEREGERDKREIRERKKKKAEPHRYKGTSRKCVICFRRFFFSKSYT